jgi:hypothetical protein
LGRGQPSPERGKLREERDVEAMRPVGPRSGRRWRKNLKSLEASRRRLSARRLLRRETRQLGEEAIRPGVGGALRSPDVGRSLLVGVDASLPASPPPSRERDAEVVPHLFTRGTLSPGSMRIGRGIVGSQASKRSGGLSRDNSARGLFGPGKLGEPLGKACNQTRPQM